MANLGSPLDDHVFGFAKRIRSVRSLFARDGEIDEEERRELEAMEAEHLNISQFRLRQHAADAWVKGGTATDYVKANFRESGFSIVSIKEGQQPSNMVRFPQPDDGPRAA